jgi:hypothetical protein
VSDKFDSDLREHLHQEAGNVNDFPRDLAGRIRDGIEPRRSFGLVQQLAVAGGLILLAGLLAYGIGQLRASSGLPAGQSPIPTASGAVQTVQPVVGLGPFSCADETWGGNGPQAQLTAVRMASHNGYERMTLEFSGSSTVPAYGLVRQKSPDFVKDASGQPVRLAGSAGLKVYLKPVTAANPLPIDKPAGADIREISLIGNFEQQVILGVGLSQPACVRVLELSKPTRLVVDFDTTPASQASPVELLPFVCADRKGGSTAAATVVAVRVAHHTGYDRIVFEFAPQPDGSSKIPSYTMIQQSSAQFTKDPSGQPANLEGSAGLRVVFRNTAAQGSAISSSPTPVVTQVRQIGEFERVVSFGIGLNRAACFRVVELTGPGRLVIDFES